MSTPQADDAAKSPGEGSALRRWVTRFGVFGFLFFLGKGLLWLSLPFLVAWGLVG